MGKPLHLLLVEDSEDDALLTVRLLERGGYDVAFERVDNPVALTSALVQREWDIIVADYSMPGFSGTAALRIVRDKGLDLPFIFVSGTIGADVAVAAMRNGAQDYLIKGDLARFLPAVERELDGAQRRKEHKQVERQLQQMEKFESLGKLAGGIAHDFNNLLGVIIGYCELLLDSEDFGKASRDRIGEIKKAGDRAATLTRQLLAFSRKQVLEPRVIDLNALVSDMSKMFLRVIGEDIRLEHIGAVELGRVLADPAQIEQVLMNLVINARDAMPQGGGLTIETNNVEMGESFVATHPGARPGPYVMLAVRDTGTGMDATTQMQIFEPFFTTKERGTGLGLATVYGIVKQSGGYIWVESELGKGTTFQVYLPRVYKSETTEEERRPASVSGGKETILLVEDAEAMRAVTATFLRNAGYQVLEASSGTEAITELQKHKGPVHMLLTDVVMPGLSGVELARQVQSQHSGLKVLFISGYTNDALVRHGVLETGIFLLSKPFSRDALLGKVRTVLDSTGRP
jgi:signal transduction histidine kinase